MDTFDVIFTTYSPLVFRYLRSLCGDAAVAEELTAETFYRAYTHFDSFRGDSKLETWLCAIAKKEMGRMWLSPQTPMALWRLVG